jgi:hypothetical protein
MMDTTQNNENLVVIRKHFLHKSSIEATAVFLISFIRIAQLFSVSQ